MNVVDSLASSVDWGVSVSLLSQDSLLTSLKVRDGGTLAMISKQENWDPREPEAGQRWGCVSQCPGDWVRLPFECAAVTHRPGLSWQEHQLLLFCLTGGSAHGKLFPGDQILQINDEFAEDLSYERAADILRY